MLNLHGNDPVQKVQFRLDYGKYKDCNVIDALSEYVMNYRSVGADDPLGGESRCRNPRIKHQRVVNL